MSCSHTFFLCNLMPSPLPCCVGGGRTEKVGIRPPFLHSTSLGALGGYLEDALEFHEGLHMNGKLSHLLVNFLFCKWSIESMLPTPRPHCSTS